MSTDTSIIASASPESATDPDDLRSQPGDLTWEIARLYPRQGSWTEAAYLNLDTNQLIEFVRGRLEFLPVPTRLHQRLARFLFKLLDEVAENTGVGEAFFAPLRVRTVDDVIREPDVLLLPVDDGSDPRAPVESMLLAIEVVSPGKRNRERDYEEKREEYAAAHVSEYWIVDEETRVVTVLVLEGDEYRVHGEFDARSAATSVLLPEFRIDVAALFETVSGPAH